jgi:hypothetical protein
MNLLGAVLYDPSSAATKGSAASVLAAFDTTNARIAFVVPPSGMVRVVIQCTVHGAATFSQYLLGCLEGSTVRGRVMPVGSQNGTALATTMMSQAVDYVVTGLTPGASVNWDAAWGCETFVANSLIKYGGPNNTTANDNFGALIFQIWDPCPIYTPTSATAPASTLHVKIDTIDDFVDTEVGAIKTKTDFLPSATAGAAGGLFIAGTNAATTITTALTTTFTGNLTGSVASVTGAVGSVTAAVTLPTIPNNWIAAAGIAANALNGKGDWNIGKTGYSLTQTFPSNFSSLSITAGGLADITQAAADKVWGTAARVLTAGTNIALAKGTGVTGFNDLSAAQVNAEVDTGIADAALATAANLATVDTVVDAIKLSTDNLPSDPADQSLVIAATNAIIAAVGTVDTVVDAIQVKTDQLTFTVANKLDVAILVVNGTPLQGDGSAGNKWRPA